MNIVTHYLATIRLVTEATIYQVTHVYIFFPLYFFRAFTGITAIFLSPRPSSLTGEGRLPRPPNPVVAGTRQARLTWLASTWREAPAAAGLGRRRRHNVPLTAPDADSLTEPALFGRGQSGCRRP